MTKQKPSDVFTALADDVGKVDEIRAKLTPAESKLTEDRAYAWKLLGFPTVSLGGLKFSKLGLVAAGGAGAFLIFLYLSLPMAAIAALFGAGALAIVWSSSRA